MKMRQTRRTMALRGVGTNDSKTYFWVKRAYNSRYFLPTYSALHTLVFTNVWTHAALRFIKFGRKAKLEKMMKNREYLIQLAEKNDWTAPGWNFEWRSAILFDELIAITEEDMAAQIQRNKDACMHKILYKVVRYLGEGSHLMVMGISRNLLQHLHKSYFTDKLISDYTKWYVSGNEKSVVEFMMMHEDWSDHITRSQASSLSFTKLYSE